MIENRHIGTPHVDSVLVFRRPFESVQADHQVPRRFFSDLIRGWRLGIGAQEAENRTCWYALYLLIP